MQYNKPLDNLTNKEMHDLLQDIIDDCVSYAGDSYEEFGKNIVDNLRMLKLVDYGFSKEQKLAQKYTYLSDCLSTEQFKSLCEACDYDEDTLEDFNNQVKDYYAGKTVSSIFYEALEENKIEKYIKEYDKFYHGLSDDIDIYNTHNDNDKDIEMY